MAEPVVKAEPCEDEEEDDNRIYAIMKLNELTWLHLAYTILVVNFKAWQRNFQAHRGGEWNQGVINSHTSLGGWLRNIVCHLLTMYLDLR